MSLFLFIRYFIWPILSKKCCQKRGFGKKNKTGDDHIGVIHKNEKAVGGGIQTFCGLSRSLLKQKVLDVLNANSDK